MMDDTRECPSCALEVDRSADVCPYCGYEFPEQKSGVSIVAWVLVLLLLWPAIKGLMYLFG